MSPGLRPHVLVVDDDPGIREALPCALADTYAVYTAATGPEATAHLRTYPINAIILDAMLGEEHGLDLVAPFRRLSTAPILLLTGYGSEALAMQAIDAQVTKYLTKPVAVPQLRATLAEVTAAPDSLRGVAARARRYLDAYPPKPFDPAALAGQLGICEAYLRRLFRTVYRTTPRRYLTELRLARAATLLRTTTRSIEQIAADVGLASPVQFSRTFRAAVGVLPSAYRAAAWAPHPGDVLAPPDRPGPKSSVF